MVVVWFDVVAPDGSEHVSSYVARDGEILTASCSEITVRATGANSTWPPVHGGGPPTGFHISADVEGEGMLEIDVTHKTLISVDPGTLYRWVGSVSGGFGDGTEWSGPALYEQFTF